jgi:hypothetical protein
MSQYAAEAPPASADPELAEFLVRQLLAIQNALTNNSIVMEVAEIPRIPIAGAIINLNDRDDKTANGFYACVYNSQGEGEWKKMALTELPPETP